MISYQPARVPRTAERFRHGKLPVIGLIGGIGAGKSEVAGILKERGAVVIDADAVGHGLLHDPEVRKRIVERFGSAVLTGADDDLSAPAAIDRRTLGGIVFGDPKARRDLELILHPRMRAWFLTAIDRELRSEGSAGRLVVLDAAILLEAGWDDLCDLIVFVDAPRDERLNRAERQRGWSSATFAAREQAQWPCDEKRRLADVVISNDGGIDSLHREVDRVLARVAELSSPMIEASHS
jgi:dephospho-CoA kinase